MNLFENELADICLCHFIPDTFLNIMILKSINSQLNEHCFIHFTKSGKDPVGLWDAEMFLSGFLQDSSLWFHGFPLSILEFIHFDFRAFSEIFHKICFFMNLSITKPLFII